MLITELGVNEIVVGLPKNMDGSVGSRPKSSLEWIRVLQQRIDHPVVTWMNVFRRWGLQDSSGSECIEEEEEEGHRTNWLPSSSFRVISIRAGTPQMGYLTRRKVFLVLLCFVFPALLLGWFFPLSASKRPLPESSISRRDCLLRRYPEILEREGVVPQRLLLLSGHHPPRAEDPYQGGGV